MISCLSIWKFNLPWGGGNDLGHWLTQPDSHQQKRHHWVEWKWREPWKRCQSEELKPGHSQMTGRWISNNEEKKVSLNLWGEASQSRVPMAGKSLQSAALPVQIFPAMEITETSPEKPVWLARELSDELQCERVTQKDGKENSGSRTK